MKMMKELEELIYGRRWKDFNMDILAKWRIDPLINNYAFLKCISIKKKISKFWGVENMNNGIN